MGAHRSETASIRQNFVSLSFDCDLDLLKTLEMVLERQGVSLTLSIVRAELENGASSRNQTFLQCQ